MAKNGLHDQLAKIGADVKERFDAEKRVLSFAEYLELLAKFPARHTRDASRYVRDAFDHFGSYEVDKPYGRFRRFRIFDLLSAGGLEDGVQSPHKREYLVGHEAIQEAVYRILSNFAREGRSNRLTLLHGPNGSAKSTFAACVIRGLEQYSMTDEGAQYSFSWVFPRGRDNKSIGFQEAALASGFGDSFAHLPESQIDAKMHSELREHPLQILPIDVRRTLIKNVYAEADVGTKEAAPDWIWSGQLGRKNQQVFDALLTAYRGDLNKVLAHVQVERYYISQRYRSGAVTIGPQMAVDASERQITADRSLGALPASLSALTLFEPMGELVDASGGVIEYSDLLKRPLDAWKYLLLAIETGEVALQMSNISLNSVMIASSNELHLHAFKEHPEYNSFRGRLQLVRVPYLLDYRREQEIYDAQIVPQVRKHVAPHATFTAALWAVLTRLRMPDAERIRGKKLGKIATELTPLEKAELYTDGTVPIRLSTEESMELRQGTPSLYHEQDASAVYEGLTSASPREIRNLLLDASQHPAYQCMSPLAVLAGIEQFADRNDYDFLKQAPERGYHEHRVFVTQVRNRWLDRVDDEVRTATGIIEETQYMELFDRYVTHVSYWVKNERVYNRVTGKFEDPDLELMATVEKILDSEDNATTFRRDLISSVAGQAIDHPGDKVDYAQLFPRYLQRVKESYFAERRGQVSSIAEDVLLLLRGDKTLDGDRLLAATKSIAMLKTRFGYCEHCASDAISELLKSRYSS
ncbi:MAG: serine protein kinase PrkA [Sandaracinaceae bacterium]|nr:serine protein kinase PrkA [Sandaracinaceae bacterium]